MAVDALERITNLVALLLETRAPLTLEQIANELRGQYPEGEVALRGAFERDKSLLREIGVPIIGVMLTAMLGRKLGSLATSAGVAHVVRRRRSGPRAGRVRPSGPRAARHARIQSSTCGTEPLSKRSSDIEACNLKWTGSSGYIHAWRATL